MCLIKSGTEAYCAEFLTTWAFRSGRSSGILFAHIQVIHMYGKMKKNTLLEMHASKTKIIIECSASSAFAAARALKPRDLDVFLGAVVFIR